MDAETETSNLQSKVRAALLCMQRYSWEQGVCAQAFLESGEADLAVRCAHDAVVRQASDGRLGIIGDDLSVVDAAANGEAVLFAYARIGETRYREAADRMLAWLDRAENRNADGIVYHRIDARQIWVDSLYMVPPFLAAAGRTADAVAQVEGYRRLLRDPATGLLSHIWDDGRQVFARTALWGVGNGWAAAGMVRVISALPKQSEEAVRLAGYVREILDAALRLQRADGLFHDVLDEGETFVETNAAQMFAYSIYRLFAMGFLGTDYLAAAEHMRDAATAKVDDLGFVRGVCGAPRFDSPGVAAEGQAFFLLMSAAKRAADDRLND
jgi:rhamnogalacturonyl hydrolase YesR